MSIASRASWLVLATIAELSITPRPAQAQQPPAARGGDVSLYLPADFADDRPLFDAGAIAPLHRACAEAALAHCPHLKGMADRELKAFPGAWLVAALSVEAKPDHAAANTPRRGVAAVTFLQLIGAHP